MLPMFIDIKLYNKLNYFLACWDFSSLLITVANSLDPDRDLQKVDLDLDPNCLTL